MERRLESQKQRRDQRSGEADRSEDTMLSTLKVEIKTTSQEMQAASRK